MNHDCETGEDRYEEDGSPIWGVVNGILVTIGIGLLLALAVYA